MQDIRMHIATSTIFKTLGILLALVLVYLVWGILLLIFVALILAALIDPFAAWFASRRIPRGLAVLLIYAILFGIIALAIVLLAPIIAHDVPQLVENLGNSWNAIQQSSLAQDIGQGIERVETSAPWFGFGGQDSVFQASGTQSAISGIFSKVSGFFGGIFSLVIILVLTFYLVVQEDAFRKITRSVVPDEYVPYVSSLIKQIKDKLGAWLRAQLALSGIIGVMVFLGLSALGVKYAAILGLIAALFEFIPYLGPMLAALPALFLAFSQGGGLLFAFVGIMYIVVQQFENHILVPKMMQRVVGLNPVVSIVAMLIGARLAGVVGVLLAIPVSTALSVFLKDVFAETKRMNEH